MKWRGRLFRMSLVAAAVGLCAAADGVPRLPIPTDDVMAGAARLQHYAIALIAPADAEAATAAARPKDQQHAAD